MRKVFSILLSFGVFACAGVDNGPQVCAGADKLAELRRVNPELHAELQRRARAVPNGVGRLWRIEFPGAKPLILVGLTHLPDSRIAVLPDKLRDALSGADLLLLESDSQDSAEFWDNIAADPEVLSVGDGFPFNHGFTEDQNALARGVLEYYGRSVEDVDWLKPEFVPFVIGFSPCYAERWSAGQTSDSELVEQLGRAGGAKVVPLERSEELIGVVAELDADALRQFILVSFAKAIDANDNLETSIQSHLRGEIQLGWEYDKHAVASSGVLVDPDAALEIFWDHLIVKRNKRLADRAAPYLRRGGAVMSVGALHLPGEDGLVELLRKKGFTVTRPQ